MTRRRDLLHYGRIVRKQSAHTCSPEIVSTPPVCGAAGMNAGPNSTDFTGYVHPDFVR